MTAKRCNIIFYCVCSDYYYQSLSSLQIKSFCKNSDCLIGQVFEFILLAHGYILLAPGSRAIVSVEH